MSSNTKNDNSRNAADKAGYDNISSNHGIDTNPTEYSEHSNSNRSAAATMTFNTTSIGSYSSSIATPTTTAAREQVEQEQNQKPQQLQQQLPNVKISYNSDETVHSSSIENSADIFESPFVGTAASTEKLDDEENIVESRRTATTTKSYNRTSRTRNNMVPSSNSSSTSNGNGLYGPYQHQQYEAETTILRLLFTIAVQKLYIFFFRSDKNKFYCKYNNNNNNNNNETNTNTRHLQLSSTNLSFCRDQEAQDAVTGYGQVQRQQLRQQQQDQQQRHVAVTTPNSLERLSGVLSPRGRGGVVRGIPNFGQTCFMNSVLQSLASLSSFVQYITYHHASYCIQQQQLQQESQQHSFSLYVPCNENNQFAASSSSSTDTSAATDRYYYYKHDEDDYDDYDDSDSTCSTTSNTSSTTTSATIETVQLLSEIITKINGVGNSFCNNQSTFSEKKTLLSSLFSTKWNNRTIQCGVYHDTSPSASYIDTRPLLQIVGTVYEQFKSRSPWISSSFSSSKFTLLRILSLVAIGATQEQQDAEEFFQALMNLLIFQDKRAMTMGTGGELLTTERTKSKVAVIQATKMPSSHVLTTSGNEGLHVGQGQQQAPQVGEIVQGNDSTQYDSIECPLDVKSDESHDRSNNMYREMPTTTLIMNGGSYISTNSTASSFNNTYLSSSLASSATKASTTTTCGTSTVSVTDESEEGDSIYVEECGYSDVATCRSVTDASNHGIHQSNIEAASTTKPTILNNNSATNTKMKFPSVVSDSETKQPSASPLIPGEVRSVSPNNTTMNGIRQSKVSPLCGWIGSKLQCCACQHIRPIKNVPFFTIPIVPTFISSRYGGGGGGGLWNRSYPHHHQQLPLQNRHSPMVTKQQIGLVPQPCTLEECLEEFTRTERLDDVECRNCTIQEQRQIWHDEVLVLRGQYDQILRKAKNTISSSGNHNGRISCPAGNSGSTTSVQVLKEFQQVGMSESSKTIKSGIDILRNDLDRAETILKTLNRMSPDFLTASNNHNDDYDAYDRLHGDGGKHADPLLRIPSSTSSDPFVYKTTLESYQQNSSQNGSGLGSSSSNTIRLKRNSATKSLLITRVPTVVSIHVQRRYYDPVTNSMSKTTQHIKFPQYLDVAPYCAYNNNESGLCFRQTKSSSHSNNSNKFDNNNYSSMQSTQPSSTKGGTTRKISLKYRLSAVIEHRGNAFHGHYVCYRRNPQCDITTSDDKWLYVSDAIVQPCDWNAVQRCEAYMLFYEAV